jgi:transposase
LCREDAPQREHALRAVFSGLRYIVRTGNQWRFVPGDLPPWTAVYQQTQRWMLAGIFEILVEVGSAGRIRWRQATQGLEGTCGGRYAGPSTCLALLGTDRRAEQMLGMVPPIRAL